MKRRGFLILAFSGLMAIATAAAWRYWWMTRRVLIRLKVMNPPSNLLRNADFLACATPNLPDFWGTEAAAYLPDVTGLIEVREEADAPIKSARTLRLHNPSPDYVFTLLSAGTFVPEDKLHTFSIYLRSDTDSYRAALSIGWDKQHPITVNKTWQRYQVSYMPTGEASYRFRMSTHIRLLQAGSLFLCAPQLETAEVATPFNLALMDDHPLPVLKWAEQDESIRIPAPQAPRCLLKNGKPEVYLSIALPAKNERAFGDIAAQGFTTVTLFLPIRKWQASPQSQKQEDQKQEGQQQVAAFLAQLDLAWTRGLSVIVMLVFEASEREEERRQNAVKMINALKFHPAILAWNVLDEPSRNAAYNHQTVGADYYRVIKAADPDRPVFINENTWQTGDWGEALLQATDILSFDQYPIGQFQNPIQSIAQLYTEITPQWLATRKPLAFWLQLYGYDDAVREPTVEELRAMTYLSFIRGSRLISYWHYKPMSQPLWELMKPLTDEIRRLAEAVTQDEAQWLQVGTLERRIHYALFEHRGRFTLTLCNISPEPVEAVFDLSVLSSYQPDSPLQTLQCWYRSDNKQLKERSLKLKLEPYEREVCELS